MKYSIKTLGERMRELQLDFENKPNFISLQKFIKEWTLPNKEQEESRLNRKKE